MLYVCCWKEMKHAQKQVPYAGPLCFEPSWPSALITDITACTSVHIQEVWRGHRLNGSKFQRVLTFVWAHPNILCLSLGQLHAQCSIDFHNYNSIWDGTTRLIVIHHWGFLIDGGSKLSLSPLLCKDELVEVPVWNHERPSDDEKSLHVHPASERLGPMHVKIGCLQHSASWRFQRCRLCDELDWQPQCSLQLAHLAHSSATSLVPTVAPWLKQDHSAFLLHLKAL